MTALVFTLSSCKYISRYGDKSEVQTENVNSDPASQGTSAQDTAYTNRIKEAQELSMNMENNKTIKMLRDSIDTLSVQLYNVQSNFAELKNDVEEMRADKLSTNSFLVFIVIFFVIVIALVSFLIKKFGHSIKKDVERIASNIMIKEPTGLNNRGQGVSNNDYFRIMKKMTSLEQMINDINLRVSKIGSTKITDNISNNTSDVNNLVSTPKANSRIFYLCKPSNEREFLDKDRRLVAQEDYFYKFELHKGDTQKASFEFCATKENCIRWALDSQSTMIDRACDTDIVNRYNGRCQCTDNGEAELRGDKWVVTKKAKVKFY